MLTLVNVLFSLLVSVFCNEITFNYEKEDFWTQTKEATVKTDDYIDGNKVPSEIKVVTMHIGRPRYTYAYTVNIRNFPDLQEVYVLKSGVTKMVSLNNLPVIKKLSAQNNDIELVPKGAISSTSLETVILSTNAIKEIEGGAFGANITEVYLTCNNLTKISPKWFANPKILKRFYVAGNKIRTIPKDMFKNFDSLGSINLRNNEILTIGEGAFSGLKNLGELQLSYNNLTEIKPNVLGPSTDILEIGLWDVQYNLLTFLHEDLLNRIRIREIKIWGNPWQCPCRDKIYDWWKKSGTDEDYIRPGLHRDGDPSCVFAQSFQDVCVYAVDKELHNYFFTNFEVHPINFCAVFA